MSTIYQRIEASLARNFPGPVKFLLAVSGGPDSQLLLDAFPYVAKRLGHVVVGAVGVNHGLRKEAGSELDLAESLARSLGVEFRRVGVEVPPGSNLLARARDERYKALRFEASKLGATFIVTAHHRDDLVETVLFRLMRNGALGSLNVLDAVEGDLFRPLLDVTREEIMGQIRYRKLRYATDPSNSNDRFDRVWIRNHLLPMMRSRFPDVDNKVGKLAGDVKKFMIGR